VPKQDISRRAVLKAADRLGRAVELVRNQVPYGPRFVHMKPSELKRTLERNRADKVLEFMDLMGQDETMNVLRERNGNTGF